MVEENVRSQVALWTKGWQPWRKRKELETKLREVCVGSTDYMVLHRSVELIRLIRHSVINPLEQTNFLLDLNLYYC